MNGSDGDAGNDAGENDAGENKAAESVEAKRPAVDDGDMEKLVRRFYALAHADPVLGPFFEKTIADFEAHVQTVADFWSSSLLKTGRYRGNQFMAHARHPIKPEHFDLWLTLFEQATRETLPPAMATEAMIKAQMMGRSIKAGMFAVPRAVSSGDA